ncbi:hypothetical protein Cni_G17587 [Canna indica]|uniref:Uncharacterized protein n=1 Tax=Canna indica TaxID=4628 RepID=A0AAQ3QFA0_9LILI|nr:hypothetical protein Cni_G17587 [Canna indica]
MNNHYQKPRLSPDAVGGKTARPCDGCLRRRARWYCAADDAFLCRICDCSVHSVNPLLCLHHHRVRLTAATNPADKPGESPPGWLAGFKRKARVPRPHPHSTNPMGAMDEGTGGREKEELLCRVPVLNASLDDSSSSSSWEDAQPEMELSDHAPFSSSAVAANNEMAGFLPSDSEINEFAGKIESLLGGGGLVGGDDTFCMKKMELVEPVLCDHLASNSERVKMEQVDHDKGECQVELELNFEWSLPTVRADRNEEETVGDVVERGEEKKAKLRLDYESVIMAWSSQGSSPWTDGERPQINLDNCWPNYMDMWIGRGRQITQRSEMEGWVGDGEREARVTRYREKRRTRLFSKKIRYEVRKLNAEKRPRMKGRFVKRSTDLAFGHC